MDIADIVLRLQSEGLRLGTVTEGRKGGAGPSDVGMIWVDDLALTLDTDPARVQQLTVRARAIDDARVPAIYEDGRRVAGARTQPRPRYYDLTTADGVPYWKIALLHLDSLASTVLQTCAYWGNDDQCTFCGIGADARRRPHHRQEDAGHAGRGGGGGAGPRRRGRRHADHREHTRHRTAARSTSAQCGQAVKEASGLPVEVQFEPPEDLDVIDQVHDMGVDTVGIHVETFDPEVLARVAPAKARTGIARYFAAWERAVARFGPGQVTTYVILGMGEDPELTVDGCRRAIDLGVYPFVVPLRPVAGSLMGDWPPPAPADVERVARRRRPLPRGPAASARARRRPGAPAATPARRWRRSSGGSRSARKPVAVGPWLTRSLVPVPVRARPRAGCRPVADDAWSLDHHHRIRHAGLRRGAAALRPATTSTSTTTTRPRSRCSASVGRRTGRGRAALPARRRRSRCGRATAWPSSRPHRRLQPPAHRSCASPCAPPASLGGERHGRPHPAGQRRLLRAAGLAARRRGGDLRRRRAPADGDRRFSPVDGLSQGSAGG